MARQQSPLESPPKGPELVPTVAIKGAGRLDIAYLYAQYDPPFGEGPGPSIEEQSAREQALRAAIFLRSSARASTPRESVALLAASIVFGVASREHVEAHADRKLLPPAAVSASKQIGYRSLLNVVRNHELHGFSLPWIDGDYWLGLTNLVGSAQIQIVQAAPKKWRKNGRIETNRPLVLAVRSGRIGVFDESAHRAVDLHFAVSTYVGDLLKWLDTVFL